MSSVAANSADDACGEIALLRTVELSVADLTAVLAGLVLIIAEGAVKCGKFTQLVTLELVLAFWNGCSLGYVKRVLWMKHLGGKTYGFNNVVDQLLGFIDLLLGVCHDQAMKIFLLVASVSGVGTTLSFFNGSLSTDGDFGLRFSFHLFERVSTRSDK